VAERLKSKRPTVSKQPQVVEVADLTGGVNLRVAPTLLESDQARHCRNFSLEEPGALRVRPGYMQFSTASFGSGRGQGGQRVYLSSHAFTLFAHNSSVYLVDDAGVGTSVLSGLSTRQIFFPYDRDMVVALDGTNRPQKSTDGSNWTNFGIDAPSVQPTASTLSSGVCSSGEYEFAYSYKDRALTYESNISSGSTITLTGSSGAFHLQATASTEAHVDAYVWYGRDITAGETVLRKISSGSASTFRVTDTNWTASDEAPTNHDVLGKALFGVVWKNRWWVVDPDVTNRVKFSEIFLPQAFPALYYIDIPFERGDSIAAIVPLGDVLVVFGQTRVYVIIGQTSLDFEVRPSGGSIAGALGPRAVSVVEQGVVHANAEGVHIFDGATDRLLTHNIETAWRDYIANTVGAELAKTPMVYETRRKCLRVGVGRAYPTGAPGEWELNLDRTRQGGKEAWTQTGRAIGGYIHFDGAENQTHRNGELVSWSDTTGLLFKESTGASANSSNVTAEYEGPTLALGLHKARVIELHGEYEPGDGTFSIEPSVDGVSQGTYPITIGQGLSKYDEAVYGTGTYDSVERRKWYQILPLAAEGRTLTLKQTYTGQSRFRSFTYAAIIKPESQPRTFSE
jgi:hypothetical protein